METHERSESNVDDEILMKGLFIVLICYTEFEIEVIEYFSLKQLNLIHIRPFRPFFVGWVERERNPPIQNEGQ
jgi:hypothetical protein